jgi:hypothetical protein
MKVAQAKLAMFLAAARRIVAAAAANAVRISKPIRQPATLGASMFLAGAIVSVQATKESFGIGPAMYAAAAWLVVIGAMLMRGAGNGEQ